jgi:hypothetical protein
LPKTQKSVYRVIVEISEGNTSMFKPLAEIANCNDLLPNRVIGVTSRLLGNRKSVNVLAQWSLSYPLDRRRESEELIYHSFRVATGASGLCRVNQHREPIQPGSKGEMRHSPVRGIVPEQVRANGFRNASPLRRFPASFPQHFGRDWLVCPRAVHGTREQVRLRLHPAPVLT